jgi:hypothetical protein
MRANFSSNTRHPAKFCSQDTLIARDEQGRRAPKGPPRAGSGRIVRQKVVKEIMNSVDGFDIIPRHVA